MDTLAPPPVGTDDDTLVPAIPLAAGVGIFVTVGTFFASQGERVARPFDAGTVALIAIASVALAFRRRAPVPVLLAVFATVLVYELLGYANGPMWLFLVVALLNAVIRGHRWPAAAVVLLGFAIFPWLDRLLRDGHSPSFASVAALAAWLLVLFGVGEAIRIRRERAAETVRIREEEALRRASEERLRIARELHDALGHHLSLISVQAGVALHVNETLPDEVRGSLSAIKDASKEALTELRSVLEILRQDGERAPRSPMSTLARLDELIAQARAAGIDVHAETEGDVRPLPFGADVAAYRIVQEALTNVTRHAGSATATVRLAYGEHDLTLEIADDGRGVSTTSGVVGSGKGLVGMRERAAALGGELEAGPRPGGGFRVWARLPTEAR